MSTHDPGNRTLWVISLDLIKDPMFALLLSGGLLYLALGAWHEAVLLLIFVVVIFALTAGQSLRTSHALKALGELAAPRSMTLRNGKRIWLPSADLIVGDVVFLSEGIRIPADGRLVDGMGLMVDESVLTGEFQPVFKRAAIPKSGPGDPSGALFCGSLVISGTGTMRVDLTGDATRLGQIGMSMREIAPERAPLEKQTRHFILRFMWLGFALSLLTWALYVYLRGGWLEGMLAAVTLAMGLLPQDFPVVVTIFSALEARRLASQGVLIRKLSAVETLGKTTVLCADKTGTLTCATMSVRRIYAASTRIEVSASNLVDWPQASDDARMLANTALLASVPDSGDAMDDAFRTLASALRGPLPAGTPAEMTLVKTYPFSTDLPAVTQVWRLPDDARMIVACKGAPEAVFRLCGLDILRTSEQEREVRSMAGDGLRVLAVAQGGLPDGPLPDKPDGFALTFVGLVALENPLKPNVRESVLACRSAGIRVLMLTGDHPATAKALAGQAGIRDDAVILGDALEKESDDQLLSLTRRVSVYARVKPEQKLRLVQILKQDGAIVAMTGDGVNDAPALRAAHVGIAMGARGTDVAREAADIVLTEDDFSDILGAITQSRRLFDNLTKAIVYIVAAHVPLAGLVIVPLIAGWPEILRPAHVAFLEIVIGPLCSLAFESLAAEPDLMRRPPLPAVRPLVSLRSFLLGFTQGAILLVGTLLLFAWSHQVGLPDSGGRALAFCALILGNLALVLANSGAAGARTSAPARSIFLAAATTLAMLLLALEWPVLRRLFAFSALGAREWLLALAVTWTLWLAARALLRWNPWPRPSRIIEPGETP
ncbi:Calcium-transporting ATPase 1 [Achromobacter anxifer]|uniref:Calcium-transporting ATPase 1 n=1 Tax=Achromobacter anxifer TaxID=1287737 RepID=A0A6S7CYA6_9BURK|nr:cation-translocating P-type ATPase [Achromobacter anxifer]CAB3824135.1 Calcium-transporting ATPase 1 [Achromobacter anxifer]